VCCALQPLAVTPLTRDACAVVMLCADEKESVEAALTRSLQRYLLKSVASQAYDLLLRAAAVHNELPVEWATPSAASAASASAAPPTDPASDLLVRPVTAKERSDILKNIPSQISKQLQALATTLTLDVSGLHFAFASPSPPPPPRHDL
jgi:hypothetical protein